MYLKELEPYYQIQDTLQMTNPISSLKIDSWYQAVLAIASVTLILSLTIEVQAIENKELLVLSLAAIAISLGEWVNHPIQTQVIPPSIDCPTGLIGTGRKRKNTITGNLMLGIGLLIALSVLWNMYFTKL